MRPPPNGKMSTKSPTPGRKNPDQSRARDHLHLDRPGAARPPVYRSLDRLREQPYNTRCAQSGRRLKTVSPETSAPTKADPQFQAASDGAGLIRRPVRGCPFAKPPEIVGEIVHRVISIVWRFGEALFDDALEREKHARPERQHRLRLAFQDRADQARLALTLERFLPRHHLVDNGPEREDRRCRAWFHSRDQLVLLEAIF